MIVKLKHILSLPLNKEYGYGKITHYMIWSPVHHLWIHAIKDLPERDRKFLLKQKVEKLGLRNDSPNDIAIFLHDYGEEKNKKLHRRMVW